MVSTLVLTAAPLEAPLLPELPLPPIELSARFCAALAAALVDLVAAGDVVQTPLDGDVVTEADDAAVGVEEVIGENVDVELDDGDELGDDVVVAVESVAVGSASDGADVVSVVVDPDEADVVAATLVVEADTTVPVDDEPVDDGLVEAIVFDALVVVVLVVVVDSAAAEAGEHAVMAEAGAAGGPETVPALALVVWVPLAEPPEALMKMLFRISAFCQYFGAASITTWYWLSGL
jgi:hypothetical protein